MSCLRQRELCLPRFLQHAQVWGSQAWLERSGTRLRPSRKRHCWGRQLGNATSATGANANENGADGADAGTSARHALARLAHRHRQATANARSSPGLCQRPHQWQKQWAPGRAMQQLGVPKLREQQLCRPRLLQHEEVRATAQFGGLDVHPVQQHQFPRSPGLQHAEVPRTAKRRACTGRGGAGVEGRRQGQGAMMTPRHSRASGGGGGGICILRGRRQQNVLLRLGGDAGSGGGGVPTTAADAFFVATFAVVAMASDAAISGKCALAACLSDA